MIINIDFKFLKETYGVEDLDVKWTHNEEKFDEITNGCDKYIETLVLIAGENYKIVQETELEHNITNNVIYILID
jgi:hypothetical protein